MKRCKTILFLSLLLLLTGDSTLLSSEEPPALLNPELKFPTAESYEKQIGEPAVLLDSPYVILFAPKAKETEAKIIFDYLVKACDELYKIVGLHTEYKIVVYHFPKTDENAKGGTSNCTIWYSYDNLELESFEEWNEYHLPHLDGYIEEMAHNFVGAAHAQFGWEMVGWSISTKVMRKIADNPVFRRNLKITRKKQKETFLRYRRAGYVFPQDLPANKCDRIHAYLLWQCERKYGPTFWEDFFAEIRKQRDSLHRAGDDRDRRYQITIDCFDKLRNLDFKKLLSEYRISLTTDVKSLRPEEEGWDRRLLSASEQKQ